MLAITDTGTGMTKEVLERAVEPFFTTKPEGQGTGLGLSMAFGFAKQSNGHFRIYSELGHGTTIKIYFPRSHEGEEILSAPMPTKVTGGTETILVVEDDLTVQQTVVEMLSSLGYKVLKADNAMTALAVLKAGVHCDLLFTDVVMPGELKSPDLARQAKALIPSLQVLYTSGYTQNAIIHGGRLDPGVQLLSKPYRREELALKVHQILKDRAREAQSLAMSMLEYLDLVSTGTQDLPPYLGNLELRELNRMCYWPAYFGKMGPPRFWLGPLGTVTPLHCDYDDNIFAQIWGTKRIFLSPPHHDEFLYTSEANAVLFGSPVNPEAPDFEKFPLARQASMIECTINPGELLYVPAGWYHHVRSLTFSLSANRWARAMPFALNGDPSLQRMRLSG